MERILRNGDRWQVRDRGGTPRRTFKTEAEARQFLADEPARLAAKRASGTYRDGEGMTWRA